MFTQIKIYIYSAIAAAFAGIVLYAKFQSSRKEHYKAESNLNKEKAESLDKRVEVYEKRKEIEQVVASTSDADVDVGLQQYYRD